MTYQIKTPVSVAMTEQMSQTLRVMAAKRNLSRSALLCQLAEDFIRDEMSFEGSQQDFADLPFATTDQPSTPR